MTFFFSWHTLLLNTTSEPNNRLVFSLFPLFIAMLLLYFWLISREKAVANKKDSSGLVYLAFAFLLYAVLGITTLLKPLPESGVIPGSYLIVAGLISLCYLSSLSFFRIGNGTLDKLVSSRGWQNGVKYFGFAWVIIISLGAFPEVLLIVDIVISVVAFLTFGYFISRYFLQRGLRFLALVSALAFGFYVFLQIFTPFGWEDGKFVHLNSLMLGPSLTFAVIILSYTFNWINELNFYELSNIWVNQEATQENDSPKTYAQLTTNANRDTWMEKIAQDKLEKVIEEIIILKKHKNENLEIILNIASRNTRNNNNHLQQLIKYQDYQLNRNQVSHSLVQLVEAG